MSRCEYLLKNISKKDREKFGGKEKLRTFASAKRENDEVIREFSRIWQSSEK